MTFIASSEVCRVTIQSITHGRYMACSDTLQIAAIRSKCSESATFERECHLKEIEMKAETDYYLECFTYAFYRHVSCCFDGKCSSRVVYYSLKCDVLILFNNSVFISCKRTDFISR